MTSRNTWPDCDKDPQGCFERYLRMKIDGMRKFGVSQIKIGQFDDSYELVFKKVSDEMNVSDGHFWWNLRSINIGTVKDRYVYEMDLYWK